MRAAEMRGSPTPVSGVAVRVAVATLLVAGALVALRALPADEALTVLLARVESAGPLGGLAFAALYVAASLLFIPGSALTAAGGALFGLVEGTLLVSVSSVTAAAVAFLAARHLAPPRVEQLAARYPAFRALDRAIGEGGWKVVGLLRLSPVVPFSVSNYLFGLTRVRFWPYLFASWAFMLPGSLLYVWLGHAGRLAASGSRSGAEWALLGGGLAATAGVTAYLTRLARRTLERGEVAAPDPPLENRPEAGAAAAAAVAGRSAA